MLGAFYMRLVGKPLDVYQYLEPLYNDYRRVRRRLLEVRTAGAGVLRAATPCTERRARRRRGATRCATWTNSSRSC